MLLTHAWLASQTQFRVRTAIGIGPLFVETSLIAHNQDGPAFHVARKQILLIHKQKQTHQISCYGQGPAVWFCNKAFLIGCRLVHSIWSRWTQPQWEAALFHWEGKNSREVADYLGVQPPNISKRLKSARFWVVNDTFKNFEEMLEQTELLAEICPPSATGLIT